ncbi:Rossmann-like and DUF2520 domain-containing protein [Mucilaginibacter xinganensis]|uniref:Oxidoreductase n=1 Tax=Mucilaginibacter xinganensis TaxID=1234841 RepID=A0A223P0I7_9SPHI|nr:DUF2520 domain-containing protein [Mucilaginibacter xinganensis]ASU35351.1 oxidoreductase [Mucilaginibacter xinganensis]
MLNNNTMRITIIGSGNVATHLAAAFKNAGHYIVQVYSRDMHNAALLAYHVGAEAIDSLEQISNEADMFIIAVKDDAIKAVAAALIKHEKLIVHTSGATDMVVLEALTANAGVFYPLQTFSKTKEVDFLTVPLCIEGAGEPITKQLVELAQTVSNNVYRVNSSQRKVLHLSAVFACNFPNYLYGAAQQLLAEQGMDFEMLRPLILETAQKVQMHLPAEVQTGPAVRNDEITMASHLQMLANEPDLFAIYSLLSQQIIKNNNAGTQHG